MEIKGPPKIHIKIHTGRKTVAAPLNTGGSGKNQHMILQPMKHTTAIMRKVAASIVPVGKGITISLKQLPQRRTQLLRNITKNILKCKKALSLQPLVADELPNKITNNSIKSGESKPTKSSSSSMLHMISTYQSHLLQAGQWYKEDHSKRRANQHK